MAVLFRCCQWWDTNNNVKLSVFHSTKHYFSKMQHFYHTSVFAKKTKLKKQHKCFFFWIFDTFFVNLCSRPHIAHTWLHLAHTVFAHAVLQTFILLSGAKCTTTANLHTLRCSRPDFKRPSAAIHVGEERCPIKQQCRPLPSWVSLSASDRAAIPMWLDYGLFPSTSSFIHNIRQTPRAICNIQFKNVLW